MSTSILDPMLYNQIVWPAIMLISMTMGLPGVKGEGREKRYRHARGISQNYRVRVARLKTILYSGKWHIARRTLRRAAVLLPAENVDDVDLAIGVFPAHMGPHVWRMLRPEGTVRAVEPRRLSAWELQMMLKIIAPIKGPAALRAEIHLSANLPWMLRMLTHRSRFRVVLMLRARRRVLVSWKIQMSYRLVA